MNAIKIYQREVIFIRRVTSHILGMSDTSWSFTIGSLKLSAAFLLCALIILIDTGGLTTDTYYLHMVAREMALAPIPVILFFGLCSLVLEDYNRNHES